jgi:hypothetical protein
MLPRRGMISRPTQAPPFRPGKYRHYKGGEYQALTVACHEETHDWYVVYRPLYEHKDAPEMWIRPYTSFFGTVNLDGIITQRFVLISDVVVDAD